MTAPTETFDPILLSECQPNQPMTSELALRWRANVLASLQGAANSQRVYVQALERLTAGTTQAAIYAETQVGPVSDNSWADIWQFGMLQGGTLRFTCETRESVNNLGQAEVRIVRMRSDVETNISVGSVDGTTFTALSLDVSVQPGDLFTVQHRQTQNNNAAAETRNMRLSTTGQDLYPTTGLHGRTTLITSLT